MTNAVVRVTLYTVLCPKCGASIDKADGSGDWEPADANVTVRCQCGKALKVKIPR